MASYIIPSFRGIHPAVQEYARARGADVVLDDLSMFFRAMSPQISGYKSPLYKPIMMRTGVTCVDNAYKFDAMVVHSMWRSFVVLGTKDLQSWLCGNAPPVSEEEVLFVELLSDGPGQYDEDAPADLG